MDNSNNHNEEENLFEEQLQELKEWQTNHNHVPQSGIPSNVTKKSLTAPLFLLILGIMLFLCGLVIILSQININYQLSNIFQGILYLAFGIAAIANFIISILKKKA